MGNSFNTKPLPIDAVFQLPSPIPSWPPGEGFATGTIDLGGLRVRQVSTFNKVWATRAGGPDNLGATFYEPAQIPEGFSMLGSYCQPNNKALFGWVLVAEDVADSSDPSEPSLKTPVDYALVWSSDTLKIKQDGNAYVWLPQPPEGYSSVGHVVTNSPQKPAPDKVRCVRSDLTESAEAESWIWGPGKEMSQNGPNVYASRPVRRGAEALGVPTGSFIFQRSGGAVPSFSCLKNASEVIFGPMPVLSQIEALIQAYSPIIYLHPDEEYLPSSVNWYFQNGALLYKKGEESNPTPIEPDGSNLPQGGSNDGAYWLDLPLEESAKERVKKGYLQQAGAYFHVKPAFGGTFTDVQIWVFYPFNGPARAKVELINVPLGKIGEHVGDWEHVTLRVSNFDGELKSAYFSEHSGGAWVRASDLEFASANKFAAYASLHGHAFYSKPGLDLQGNGGIGIRNDRARGASAMDTGVRSAVVAAEHLGSAVVEPPWLNYARLWGPKISYDIADEVSRVERSLPVGRLREAFGKFVKGLPREIQGEEGPTGPKMKDYWSGDERS